MSSDKWYIEISKDQFAEAEKELANHLEEITWMGTNIHIQGLRLKAYIDKHLSRLKNFFLDATQLEFLNKFLEGTCLQDEITFIFRPLSISPSGRLVQKTFTFKNGLKRYNYLRYPIDVIGLVTRVDNLYVKQKNDESRYLSIGFFCDHEHDWFYCYFDPVLVHEAYVRRNIQMVGVEHLKFFRCDGIFGLKKLIQEVLLKKQLKK